MYYVRRTHQQIRQIGSHGQEQRRPQSAGDKQDVRSPRVCVAQRGAFVSLYYFTTSIIISSEDFGVCPYCDPNFSSVPGMAQALMGYDLPMGDPNPGGGDIKNSINKKNYRSGESPSTLLTGPGRSDPGIRHKIFSAMRRSRDSLGLIEVA